ncbi:hypothetical protein [Alloacidobacterium sp.]|uniref:hypothetical protein n=1 Tax=Alloacidobacterium sp. TaxID=2951999 RepID=UPI002D641138|nr:hypothetical protein [Alloacidobacterium sp.]HYK34996.1 hypothetical protein [Alloacidobacterium sp.]
MRFNSITLVSTRKIVFVLGIAAIVSALVQIMLGVSFGVLAFALCSIAAGLLGFAMLGAYNLAAWWCLAYTLGNVLIALYAKTIFGQTLDSNLYTPLSSFVVEAICSFSFLCALLISTWINVGEPIFTPITDLGVLSFLSWVCFTIGIAVLLFHQYVDTRNNVEYGGITFLGDFVSMGIIARTSYVLTRSKGRRYFDSVLVAMLFLATAVGILGNGKTTTAAPWISFFATILFFKGSLPWRYIIGLACGVVVFASAIAPAIHVFRNMGLRNLTLTEEIQAFEYTIPLILSPEEFSFKTGELDRQPSGYYYYFGGNKAQIILGRYVSVQQIDPAIAATEASEPMGSDLVVSALRRQLPTFVDPNKPKTTNAFMILVHDGLTNASHGAYPTLPFAGEIYVAFGMNGVIYVPFLVFLACMLVLKKVGWSLHQNIVAIYIFCIDVVHIQESDLSGFIGFIFRYIPLMCLILLLLMKMYRWLTFRQIPEKALTALSTVRQRDSTL